MLRVPHNAVLRLMFRDHPVVCSDQGACLPVTGWIAYQSKGALHARLVSSHESRKIELRCHSRSGIWPFATSLPGAGWRASGFVGSACLSQAEFETRAKLRVEFFSGDELLVCVPVDIPFSENVRREPAEVLGVDGETVVVCMATYNPDPNLLKLQIDSLRAQTYKNWVCLIQDDASRSYLQSGILSEIRNDRRFHLYSADQNFNFYRNFERCLARVPAQAGYVALSDQDDYWYPNKLHELVKAIQRSGSSLAFSDSRVTDCDRQVIRSSFFTEKEDNSQNFKRLLFGNTVTGGASLFKRSLLERALPFPFAPHLVFHDHWLALCALREGGITFVPQPLMDYIQHTENHTGVRNPGLVHPKLFVINILRYLKHYVIANLSIPVLSPRHRVMAFQHSRPLMDFIEFGYPLLWSFSTELLKRYPEMPQAHREVLEDIVKPDLGFFYHEAKECLERPRSTRYNEGHVATSLWFQQILQFLPSLQRYI